MPAVKVRFDARMLGHSGIGTQVQNALRRLVRDKRVRLHLVGDPAAIHAYLPEYDGPVTPFKARIYSPAEQFFFPRPESDELLHSPHYNAPAPHLRSAIVVLHDLIHIQSREFAAPHYRAYSYIMLSLVASFARRIVTVSETTRLEFLKRFPRAAARTSVNVNGLDHALFRPPRDADVSAFRARRKLPAEFLLCVGIGKRHKNVDFVVRALAPEWKSGRLKTPLAIAGSGGALPDYVAQAVQELGVADRILSLPYVDESELPLLYAAAQVFIMPSLYEGFGFPLAEAMACGAPTLASNAASLPEVGADAAVYFDPRNAGSFLSAFHSIQSDKKLRAQNIKAGKLRARFFDWDRHCESLVQTYEEAARERAAR